MRNRAAGIALAIGIVGVGAVLLTVGFALLASLAVVGGLIGGGYALYHRLRGTSKSLPGQRQRVGFTSSALDPTLEVKPTRPAIVRPIDPKDDDTMR